MFDYIFDQINVALVSIRDFLKKLINNLTIHKLLNSSVTDIKVKMWLWKCKCTVHTSDMGPEGVEMSGEVAYVSDTWRHSPHQQPSQHWPLLSQLWNCSALKIHPVFLWTLNGVFHCVWFPFCIDEFHISTAALTTTPHHHRDRATWQPSIFPQSRG